MQKPTDEQLLKLFEEHSAVELAERYNRTRATIYNWLHQAGWEAPDNGVDSIGCDECEVDPVARGLCRKCYNKAWREGILDQFPKGEPVWKENLKKV